MPLESVLPSDRHADQWVSLIRSISHDIDGDVLREEHVRLAKELMKVDLPNIPSDAILTEEWMSSPTQIIKEVPKIFIVPNAVGITDVIVWVDDINKTSGFKVVISNNQATIMSNVTVNNVLVKIIYRR